MKDTTTIQIAEPVAKAIRKTTTYGVTFWKYRGWRIVYCSATCFTIYDGSKIDDRDACNGTVTHHRNRKSAMRRIDYELDHRGKPITLYVQSTKGK